MNYMPIVPIPLLDILDASRVKDVFILSQFWDEREYRDFYRTREWNTVIIDNDLYEKEEAADIGMMVDIAREIHAKQTFVVGPEVLSSGIKTAMLTQKICEDLPTMNKWRGYMTLMCILHEKPNEMKTQYKMLKDIEGLAYGISIFSARLGYDRAALARFVGIDQSQSYVHAFGWDNLLEVLNMQQAGFNSVDSSIASTAGVHGIDLRADWQITREPGRAGVIASDRIPIDTCREFSDEQRVRVLENIQFLREWCSPQVMHHYVTGSVQFTGNR